MHGRDAHTFGASALGDGGGVAGAAASGAGALGAAAGCADAVPASQGRRRCLPLAILPDENENGRMIHRKDGETLRCDAMSYIEE